METVTMEEFFAAVGPRDVHPKVDVSTLKSRHHLSRWETRQRVLVGTSLTDSWGIEGAVYKLAPGSVLEFMEKHTK